MTTGQDQILSAVRAALAGQWRAEGRVCVGLSGGLDSVVLLHALVQLQAETPFELSALHVHHGLSPNADHWAGFCRDLCARLTVPCEVVRLQLPNASGKGLERVAREARYAEFAAAPGDILCLAHHQNDRAETLLLNLFRGAGATGLGGVPDVRQLGQKTLIRPLVETSRAALMAWATAHQLRWIEDESNQNLAFRRNYVRHRILPVIADRYPGVVDVLARTSAQMTEQAALLNRLAEHEMIAEDAHGLACGRAHGGKAHAFDEAAENAFGRFTRLNNARGDTERPSGCRHQKRIGFAFVMGEIALAEFVFDEAISCRSIGNPKQRFGQHHQGEAFAGGEGIFAQQFFDAAEAA